MVDEDFRRDDDMCAFGGRQRTEQRCEQEDGEGERGFHAMVAARFDQTSSSPVSVLLLELKRSDAMPARWSIER